MARSSYIYVVATVSDIPIATFTVKHECKTWLHSYLAQKDHDYSLKVLRFKDGWRQLPFDDTDVTQEFLINV